ncbi:MAG: quinohemoprotein amine dehydrogenase subunit alpha [Vicinamibacterales bacterium]
MGIFTERAAALSGAFLCSLLIAAPGARQAQQPPSPPPGGAPTVEAGIPIPDTTVQAACGACHKPDEGGVMSRLSFRRNTPEGWEGTIRRMVALNGLKIEPATARAVVRYLSNHLGLAPEEVKPAAFETERRIIDFKYEASRDAERVCTACHSMGRVMLQRRSKDDWQMLVDMHRGWYPLSDFQAFRRMGPPQREPGPDGRPPDNRHPVEKALEHLRGAYPLHTAEWAAWSATMRPPKLEGIWTIAGHETGKGAIYGIARIAQGAAADEVTTEITFTYARTGQRVSRTGRAIVYTGHQWRGRSTEGGNDETSLREVMAVERDWQSMSGRWFTGGYDERGLDVTLRRASGQPSIVGTSRTAFRAGTSGQEVRLFGSNLPATLTAKDVDFGPGVTVASVSAASPHVLTVTLDVAPGAAIGPRDLVIGAALGTVVMPAAVVVYDTVDYIKVSPEWAMARTGGVSLPKGFAFFEARAFHNGRDGRPSTKDDIALGLVDAAWTLEEYSAVLNDEDVKYVGTIDPATGVFTPNVEGPNPGRPGHANNIGDVWVVASCTPDGAKRPLRARAHLLVTVPLYMRWGTEAQTLQ